MDTEDVRHSIWTNLLVDGSKNLVLDTDDYSNVFDATGDYLFLITDAVPEDEIVGGSNTNSKIIRFVSDEEPVAVTVCRDSDGGKNVYNKGTATGKSVFPDDLFLIRFGIICKSIKHLVKLFLSKSQVLKFDKHIYENQLHIRSKTD